MDFFVGIFSVIFKTLFQELLKVLSNSSTKGPDAPTFIQAPINTPTVDDINSKYERVFP